jgi:hypothetical protein
MICHQNKNIIKMEEFLQNNRTNGGTLLKIYLNFEIPILN